MGLPVLAAVLTACGGGSASSADGGTGSSSSSSDVSGSVSDGTGTSSSSTSSSSVASSIAGSTTNLTTPMGTAAAARLLMQGTFGGTQDGITSAATESYTQWFSDQAAIPVSSALSSVSGDYSDWTPAWLENATQGKDQLRQRVAFALSEILVVSGSTGLLNGRDPALAYYYDILSKDALGNFRQLLEDVTLSPAMGVFLSMMHNGKADTSTGVHADQNYAREVMQLFSIGLVKLNIDGSVVTDSSGSGVATYSQDDILGLSNVLTGWSSAPANGHTGELSWQYDYLNPAETTPMVAYEDHHDTSAKTILGGVAVPAGQSAAADLKIALDTIFNHANVGPFIGKQLIQRLVTSNPSSAYVQRVAQVFNNDGSGVRGNLLAVAEAILTDQEAVTAGTAASYGKLREPLLRVTNLWRAFNAYNASGVVSDRQTAGTLTDANQWYATFVEFPLAAPSVFNFFQPSYQLVGPLSNAGLVSPEFQITNEASLVNTDNALNALSYQYVDSAGNATGKLMDSTVMLHTAAWEALAADPGSLVDQMNLVLMGGQMSTDMRNVLVNYATAIPAAQAATRVAETADLLLSSPEYAVQR